MPIEGIGTAFGAVGDRMKPLFRSLGIAASGLSAQRQRLEVIAGNIANAETTMTPEGGPYRREVVRLTPKFTGALEGAALKAGELPSEVGSGNGVQVAAVEVDMGEGPLVYDPSHPDADETGYVRYPNVRVTDEMVDLMESRRFYEANATVFQAAKTMLRRAIDI